VAYWGADRLAAGAPDGFSGRFTDLVDKQVIGFTVLLAIGTGLLFGLAPAFQAVRISPNETLKQGARGIAGGSGRLRSALVVAELALSLVLLVGACLLLKSFYLLLRVNPGFNPQNVLTAPLILPQAKYSEAAQSDRFYTHLLEELRRMPGVRSAAAVNNLPLGDSNSDTGLLIEGQPLPQPDRVPTAWYTPVTPDYFQTMGIPLLRGRVLDKRDHAEAPLAIVINESMAKKYWPNEDPVGRRVGTNRRSAQGPTWWEVAGVVGNVRAFGLDRDEPPSFYFAHAQRPARRMNLVIRTEGDPLALAPSLRNAVWALDRDLTIPRITTLETLVGDSLAGRRFTMALLGTFAGLALVLAAVGIYGVMAYTVTQRTHEIGIRMALGAQRADVLRMVVGQGIRLAGIGVAIGMVGALALSRFLETLVFHVSPRDLATFTVVPLTLAAVALLASWIPAHRAMRVDPVVALRFE
jgi:putative ABC transport system permease protein